MRAQRALQIVRLNLCIVGKRGVARCPGDIEQHERNEDRRDLVDAAPHEPPLAGGGVDRLAATDQAIELHVDGRVDVRARVERSLDRLDGERDLAAPAPV